MRLEAKVEVSPQLAKLFGVLGEAGKKTMLDGAATRLTADIRSHIRGVGQTHHKSASALGASPTGHLQKAATSVHKVELGDAYGVSIESPGFKRVFGPVTIKPKQAQALTIPLHAWAYGRRASEVARTMNVFKVKSILATDHGGTFTPLYALKKKVTLPQDRSLLPSDQDLIESAKKGYLAVIERILGAIQ